MSKSEDHGRKTNKWRSLRGKNEFSIVYGSGYKRVGRLLVLYLLPARECAQGVVASRRVGGAVQRNRAKRLLREAMNRCSLGRPEGFSAALVAAESVSRSVLVDVSEPAFRPGKSAIQKRDRESATSADVHQEKAASLEALWVVAIARPAILTARMQDVLAEIEKLLAS